MPLISTVKDYNGFEAKAERLSLVDLVDEAAATITRFELRVCEERFANGTKGIRQMLDAGFDLAGGWAKLVSGGIDWKKTNEIGASVGVEVQVSGRSDLLAVDIMHLKDDLVNGEIDVGIIIVPDDSLSKFLTDRTPNLATAIRHVEHRAKDLPIRLLAFRHDGVGESLPKMRTNLGKR